MGRRGQRQLRRRLAATPQWANGAVARTVASLPLRLSLVLPLRCSLPLLACSFLPVPVPSLCFLSVCQSIRLPKCPLRCLLASVRSESLCRTHPPHHHAVCFRSVGLCAEGFFFCPRDSRCFPSDLFDGRSERGTRLPSGQWHRTTIPQPLPAPLPSARGNDHHHWSGRRTVLRAATGYAHSPPHRRCDCPEIKPIDQSWRATRALEPTRRTDAGGIATGTRVGIAARSLPQALTAAHARTSERP